MGVSLDELLQSRDNRRALQAELLRDNPASTLLCLTVLAPGSEKRTPQTLRVAAAGEVALRSAFEGQTTRFFARDLPTGYEAYLLTPLTPLDAKRRAVEIEDAHPIGRLFDIDVLDRDGRPIDRGAVGAQPRRCLLCDHEARYCMRAHSHTTEELLQEIQRRIDAFVLQS